MNTVEFGKDFFINNRQRLRELFSGTAPIVITASGVMQRSGDSNFQFEQDSSFWYLTGINEPDLILVMDKGKEYLITPERSATHDAFDGIVDAESVKKISGIETIMNGSAGWKQLGGRLKKVKHVATLAAAPAYIEVLGLFTNPARAQFIQKVKSINPDIELLDLREHLAKLRVVKQERELVAIQRAIDITIDTLKSVTKRRGLAKYKHEYQLEADISAGFRSRGAEGHAFLPIVAAGKQACVIHNTGNNAPMHLKDSVTVDVGAAVSHYAADITRTLSVGHKPSPRQRAVYKAVLEVQDFGLSLLKPGVILGEYEKQIEEFMGEKLRELGLIKSITTETVRHYYPHAASHFLGLDVHDVGNRYQPLEAGMVLTCEPGIYIKEESIGVRIEDDVLITPSGIDLMSRRLPRSLV